ncbi:glycosyltransferase family 2 protein [Edwardsiella tarda]|uniref:glycosyltransferase family 2 protein n=1 Tax=Edwardsiella tarda TaxID=636 RepID=UPI003A8466E2
MATNKVSVVIPTHSRPDLLNKAINSVLSQTYKPYEIIVVDDTKSDSTPQFLSMLESDITIKFERNTSSGACSSRNLGARIASGDFIAFLDDDDLWLPSKLEMQMNSLMENSYDAIFCQLIINYEGTNIQYATRARNVSNPLKEICFENFIGGTISSVIRRSVFLKLGGFDERFKAREEYDLWIRIIQLGALIKIIEKPLAIANRSFVRKRVSSNINSYEDGISLINTKHFDLINDVLSLPERKLRISKQYDFLAAQALSLGLKKVSARYYIKSFTIKPNLKSLLLSICSMFAPVMIIKIRSKI